MLFDSNVMLSVGSENNTCLSQCGLNLFGVLLLNIYMHDHSDSCILVKIPGITFWLKL